MNTASSIVTGGVTLSAATLVPAVQWALNGFPHPIPDGIPYLVAAGLVTGAHALYNYLVARGEAKASLVDAKPATPAQ